MTTHMFIPTKGRAGSQKTLRAMSPSFKKNHLTMVVPKSELSLHKEQPYFSEVDWMTVPDGLHLTDKRLLIANRFAKVGGKTIMFADDDLYFRMYQPETNKYIAVMKHELQSEFCRLLLSKSKKIIGDEYGCWALGHATMFSMESRMKENVDHLVNQKCCNLFAYNVHDILEQTDRPEFKGIWGIDTCWNLETIKHGKDLYQDFAALITTDFEKDVGGASTTRTPVAVATSFLRMLLLHPGVVSRGKSGKHIHSFLRIAWAKSTAMRGKGSTTLYQEGYLNFLNELKIQKKTFKEFLKELPSPQAVEWCKARVEFLSSKNNTLFG